MGEVSDEYPEIVVIISRYEINVNGLTSAEPLRLTGAVIERHW